MNQKLSSSSITLLFFIKKAKLLKNGEAPICMRITVNGQRSEVMIKRSLAPNKWNQAKECVMGNDHTTRELNHFIEVYRTKVYQIFRQMEMDNRTVTARQIADILLGKEDAEKPKTLVELYAEHNTQVHALVGIDFAEVTAKKFDTSLLRLKEYILYQYKVKDVPLAKVDGQFVRGFDLYLKTNCRCHHNSALKHLKNLKKIIRIAISNDWIKRDPFFGIQFKEQETHVEFLSKEELDTIINMEFKIPQHNQVRDIFVFCCYTGTAYIDVVAITNDNLSKDDAGDLWLKYQRGKNGKLCRVKLLPEAIELIEKYRNKSRKTLFPIIKHDALKWNLQSIRQMADIKGALTYHMGRHSFSSLITLEAGVPIETVSKMLGHSDIKRRRFTLVLPRINFSRIWTSISMQPPI